MIEKINNIFCSPQFADLASQTLQTSEWITPSDISYAVDALRSEFLDGKKLQNFIDRHSIDTTYRGGRVGIVAAGNLPLVGFADMFYSLICGFRVTIKPSSKDPLMRAFGKLDEVTIVENFDELARVDCLIAMGSDATCALLAELFPATPTLLRGSMHSIAIVDGNETSEQIEALADDIFLYCSRGCRSVTHLYLPTGYNVEQLRFAARTMPAAWGDCYRYQRAIAVIGGENFIDGGFYLLKQSSAQATATIGYSFYNDRSEISTDRVQHIAERGNFGCAQRPTLDDFANGVDVIDFLTAISPR